MSGKSTKILIVDDEEELCENLADILSEHGYRVDFAHSASAALELLREHRYEVAILDLHLPGNESLEICRRMKETSDGRAAIIVTTYASSATPQKAIAPGALRTLLKPINVPYLLQEVRESPDSPLVLVVDDDNALCKELCTTFRDRGYVVGFATDVGQVATMLRDRTSSVVVVDTQLPKDELNAVFNTVRDANAHARTIVIAGVDEACEPVQLAIQAGANEVVLKPFDMQALLGTVNNRLAKLSEVRS